MSILGHGIDLIECERIVRILDRHEQRFLDRVLTQAEQSRARQFKKNSIPFIAGRFAAKEAILKMIGTGWRGQIAWTDMEILPDDQGQPIVSLSGETARRANEMGIRKVLLSITHTDNYASASVIGLSE